MNAYTNTVTTCIDCGEELPSGHLICEACFAFCPECEDPIENGRCTFGDCILHGTHFAVVAWSGPADECDTEQSIDAARILDTWYHGGENVAEADAEGHWETGYARTAVIEYRVRKTFPA